MVRVCVILNTMQIATLPVGLTNISLISRSPIQRSHEDTAGSRWKEEELEFEALMRMLDHKVSTDA